MSVNNFSVKTFLFRFSTFHDIEVRVSGASAFADLSDVSSLKYSFQILGPGFHLLAHLDIHQLIILTFLKGLVVMLMRLCQ